MKTALILGITGKFGREMAMALTNKGWNVKAIVRGRKHLTEQHLNYQIVEGSYQDKALLESESEGVDLIVYAINLPYPDWHRLALSMLEPVVQLAERKKYHVLFPGNVYSYEPSLTPITEDAPMVGVTPKGEIRKEMELRLLAAANNGAKVTIIRAGDFISEGEGGEWLKMMLKKRGNERFVMRQPHSSTHRHFWSYLPDLCTNAVSAVEQQSLQYELWHDSGLVLTGKDWQHAFKVIGYKLDLSDFPWWSLSILAFFVPLIREVKEMKYLWEKELILDGGKLRRQLGTEFKHSTLEMIVAQLVRKS
ncbi:NAD(P)H-binding protein [Vibrio sp. VB16]|uniref:NAD(P)H-binding protein n=1 Tax=Vibrio sp. VB16 TaxID=2785746 RepID=UPI00189EFD1C|nr:NAD(P)H-binding protein [Vibrio sp. VB16]UGA53894.1 NAD(P)H-binding protein [Vibrio sp. VB16]